MAGISVDEEEEKMPTVNVDDIAKIEPKQS